MIVVQTQIEITSDRINAPIFVLAREDATDDERTVAYAVEQWLLGLQETVARESGVQLDMELIGPQHEADATRGTASYHPERGWRAAIVHILTENGV